MSYFNGSFPFKPSIHCPNDFLVSPIYGSNMNQPYRSYTFSMD